MKPLSQDLRERVIAAVEAAEESQPIIAQRFGISLSTLEKWWARYQKTDSVAALPQGGRKPRRLQACEDLIRGLIDADKDISLAELCDRVLAETGLVASSSMMSRTVTLLRLPVKKKRCMIVNKIARVSKTCAPRSR